jgi:hypothetical protein
MREVHMNKGRVGEDRGSKEMDGCPLTIAPPLDQVLQAVVTHSAIHYYLNLILLFTVDKSCGWGWCRSSARDGIRKHGRQLDHREDRVKAAEVEGGS